MNPVAVGPQHHKDAWHKINELLKLLLGALTLGDVPDSRGDQRALFCLERTEADLDGKLPSVSAPSVQFLTLAHRPHARLDKKTRPVLRVLGSKPFGHQNL